MFDRHTLNRLYRYAYCLTGDESSACDLLQDAVERCLQQPAGAVNCTEAYAKRVLRNRFIDQSRHQARFPTQQYEEHEHLLDLDTGGLEQLLITHEQLELAWGQLDSYEREILYYWAVDNMTAQQIADSMQTARGTILSRIHRIRQRLRSSSETDEVSTQRKSPWQSN